MEHLYKENLRLEEKSIEQSIILGQLKVEKSTLTEIVSQKNLELERLQNQLKTQQTDHETRIQRIIKNQEMPDNWK